jgi:flagellar motor switch protein FliN/FliY
MSEVFSQAFSSPWSVGVKTEDSSQATESPISCFGLSLSGALQGNSAFLIPHPDALLLAQKFLQETVEPGAELNGARNEALQELLRQVAGLAATVLKSEFGEVTLQVCSMDVPSWDGVNVSLHAAEAACAATLDFRADAMLLASLSSSVAAHPPTEAPPKEQRPSAGADSNLDLLLDVNLALTLRFGQRVLTLREIVDLSSGSVIELDQQVQEPADLLLGDKLIARGEVVIVDGNYGIRITEVADARHRLESV